MTPDEVEQICEMFAHRGYVPVPISEWREWAMATKVKGTVKDGKFKPRDTAPQHARIARKAKADRVEAALRKNREAKR